MNGRGMKGTFQRTSKWRRGVIVASPFLALLAAGCSGGSFFGAPNGPSTPPPEAAAPPPSGLGRIASFFSGSSAKGPQTVAGAQPDVNCPPVDIRRGASTLTIGPTGDKTAMTLRYQVDFAREGRECAVFGGNMVMKVGIEGRVIVGPGGGPGQVNVPLRMALVEETPSGGTHPILTKFFLQPGQRGLHPYRRRDNVSAADPDRAARRLSHLCRLRSGVGGSAGQAGAEGQAEAGGERELTLIEPSS